MDCPLWGGCPVGVLAKISVLDPWTRFGPYPASLKEGKQDPLQTLGPVRRTTLSGPRQGGEILECRVHPSL